MENFKKWFKENRSTITWRTIQAFILLLLNSCGLAIFIMMWLEPQIDLNGVPENIRVLFEGKSYFAMLEFKQQAGVLFGEVIGAMLSYALIKFIYTNHKDNKMLIRQEKIEKQKEDNLSKKLDKKIDKIMEGK